MAKKVNKGERTKKEIIAAMVKSLGVVTTACRIADVSRSLYYKYYNADKEFREKCDDVQEEAIDFTESALFAQIGEGNVTAMIFYLKMKAKHRGYVERIDHVNTKVSPLEELSDKELEQRYAQLNKTVMKKIS